MTGNLDANFQGYRLLEPLGSVKGCNVFKAVSARGDEILAIKIFPLEISRNRPLLEKLQISFQSVARLNHPSILPIKSFSVHAGRPFVVMPFMESGSLKDRIECGALAAINVEVVIGGLASALEFAHSKGLVHGNLKPSHVLFDEEGNVQLNGLGEAVLMRSHARQLYSIPEGSFDYRAPEVRAGGEITPLSDQYSLGIIALQMLTNIPVEVALSGLNMLKSQGSNQISRPSPFVLDLPKRIIAVLLQALSGDPSQRFPSIQVMYQAFVAALHNEDFRLETAPESRPKSKAKAPVRRQRSRLVVIAPVIALALLLLVAIPALSSGGDGPLGGLMSLLGLNKDRNSAEVTTTDVENTGGIDLGTAVTAVNGAGVDDVSTKPTGVPVTPTVSESSGGSTSDPPNTPAPPAKTNPPNQLADTPSSLEQATETATPTPTSLETETAIPSATAMEIVPTNTPESEAPINPSSCKTNPNHRLYCTPTPSS
jgi:serine/threonine protein kinase